jgi:antagonist of KipI
LSVVHDLNLQEWLNSYSTNIKSSAGGWMGRALKKNDIIQYRSSFDFTYKKSEETFSPLSWGAVDWEEITPGEIFCIRGREWDLLTEDSRKLFTNSSFKITGMADRMGYRLTGVPLQLNNKIELISTAVSFGTVQLPQDGKPIVLMSDHQTTGGYAKIAHVISSHLPALAQKKTGDTLKFKLTDNKTAEEKVVSQIKHLQQVQFASKMNMEKLLRKHVTH